MNIKDFNEALRRKKLTVVCAESITAGLLASTIASVSGADEFNDPESNLFRRRSGSESDSVIIRIQKE